MAHRSPALFDDKNTARNDNNSLKYQFFVPLQTSEFKVYPKDSTTKERQSESHLTAILSLKNRISKRWNSDATNSLYVIHLIETESIDTELETRSLSLVRISPKGRLHWQ